MATGHQGGEFPCKTDPTPTDSNSARSTTPPPRLVAMAAHGGAVVTDEKSAFIRLADPGRSYMEVMYSTTWVDDCIQGQKLINHYLPTYRLKTGTRSVREPFTIADDRLLREFVRSKKEAGARTNGNLIYEELAEMHKQHTAQSWRDRAVRDLKLTMPPSPYEVSKAKREEATKRRQENEQEEPTRPLQSTPTRTDPSATAPSRQGVPQPSLVPELPVKDSLSGNVSTLASHITGVVAPDPELAPAELSDFDVLSFSEISSNEEEDDFHRSQMSQLSQQRSGGKQYRAPTPPLLPAKEEAPQKKHVKSIPDDWPQSPTPQSWRNSPQANLTLPNSISPPMPVQPIDSETELTDEDDIAIEQTILEKEQTSQPAVSTSPEDYAILEEEQASFPERAETLSDQRIQDRAQYLSPGRTVAPDEQAVMNREQSASPEGANSPDEQAILEREQPSSPGGAVTPDEQWVLGTEQPSSPIRDITPDEPAPLEIGASPVEASSPEEQQVVANEHSSASEGFITPDRASSSVEPIQQEKDGPQLDSFANFKLPAKLLTARPSQLRSRGVLGQARNELILTGQGSAKDRTEESEEEEEEEEEEEVVVKGDDQGEEENEEDEEEDDEEEEKALRSNGLVSKAHQQRAAKGRSEEAAPALEENDTVHLDTESSSEQSQDESQTKKPERVQQDEEEEEEEEERLIRRRPAHLRARPLVKKTNAAPKQPTVDDASGLEKEMVAHDAIQDFYRPVEDVEEATKREQLVLYLRSIFKDQVRTLMQYELVPPLKAIDILDACSGDLKLARLFVNEGMTESDQSRFWTREDDKKVFSARNEDVMDLMHKHSPVELIQRTNYLITTRNAAERFTESTNPASSTGLLKRRAALAPESGTSTKRLHVNA
ncbi:hypothetical protein EC968_006660 [Mortierella alpina]|nr:hypothetical protein EC968_006660 [Mortierella alpina]